jgi:hypothetical protein
MLVFVIRHFEGIMYLHDFKIVNLAVKQGLAKCLTIVPLPTILCNFICYQ